MRAWHLLIVIAFLITMTVAITTYFHNSFYAVDHAIPEYLQDPPESLAQHLHRQHMYYTENWGGPFQDGPDRCLPDSCHWLGGVLHCCSIRALKREKAP
jgi:hypothetical protein